MLGTDRTVELGRPAQIGLHSGSLESLAELFAESGRKTVRPNVKTLMVQGDVRTVLTLLTPNSVDCVITSPPYGDQKHYGSPDEIGDSQSTYAEYLEDLRLVFHDLRISAKEGAAMWLVLDTIKREGRSRPLPWDAIHMAEMVGWVFQDIIVWDKGKNLPWSHSGHFRGVCEFVPLLTNGRLKNFDIDAVRDNAHLSSYWVKYPERYHPLGKAPSDLWHFPIPVQGSWGKTPIRHFCPFPPELVERMIRLTTKAGDLVVDPFAGTGTTITVAGELDRRGLGIEINSSYVDSYESGGHEAILRMMRGAVQFETKDDQSLAKLIGKLRILKAPRTLFTGLSRADRMGSNARDQIAGIILDAGPEPDRVGPRPVKLILLVRGAEYLESIRQSAASLVSVPPLSKFGIQLVVDAVLATDWEAVAHCGFSDREWFVYERGVFHSYTKKVNCADAQTIVEGLTLVLPKRYPPTFANLGVRVQAGLPD